MKEKGIVFCVNVAGSFSHKHFKETLYNYLCQATLSALSIKQHNNTIPICLFYKFEGSEILNNVFFKGVFSDMIELPDIIYPESIGFTRQEVKHFRYVGKIDAMINSPYKKSIFIDIDTMVFSPIFFDLFNSLEKKDMGAVIEGSTRRKLLHKGGQVGRHLEKKEGIKLEYKIPISFPEINTGVIPFSKNNKTKKFFSLWRDLYYKNENSISILHDQESCRKAFLESDLNFFPLDRRFNQRSPAEILSPNALTEVAHNKDVIVKFLHIVKEKLKTNDLYKIVEYITSNSWNNSFLNKVKQRYHDCSPPKTYNTGFYTDYTQTLEANLKNYS